MEINCSTCLLRELRPQDAPSIAVFANDRSVWLNLRDSFPHPYTLGDAEEFITHVAAQKVQTTFAIVVDGRAAGAISLMIGTDVARFSAEIGYWLGRPFWGRGVMTDAVRAATRYAISDLKLLRVFAEPFANNLASARVLEKAGYSLEGKMARSALKDGTVLDQLLYAYAPASRDRLHQDHAVCRSHVEQR